jgi:hypothetical protein
MSWIYVLNIAGPIILIALVVTFFRLRTRNRFDAIAKKRKNEAKLIDRADYVEGPTHFPVVLSLTDRAIFYENMELAAHLDLDRIEEVEYTDELSTGRDVPHGRVLRLRSHGHIFEFVLNKKSATQWNQHLPVHRMDESGSVHAV